MKSLLLASLLILLAFNLKETAGSGELKINYVSFDSRAKDSSGNDCDNCCCFSCSQYCDPIFQICLRYGHSSTLTFFCSSSGVVSPQLKTGEYLDTNKVTFGSSIAGTVNPVVYSTNNQFDGKFEISMVVTDSDFFGDDDIDTVIIRETVTSSSSFSAQMTYSGIRTSSPTATVIKYQLVCDANYYSSYCTVYCLARNDNTGHYTCNANTGAKVCIAGYSGANCDIGICSAGYKWSKSSHSCVDIDECLTVQCEQTCTNSVGSYQCSCGAGYYLSSTTDCSAITFDILATASALSSSSLRLSWQTTYTPTTHTVSLNYKSYYRIFTASGTSSYTYFGETTVLQIDVTGLLPYRNYELYVTAIGNLNSEDSNIVTIRTNQAAPSDPPSSLSGSANSATEITIYWSAPSTESQNGILTGYVILVNSTSNSDQGWTTSEIVISSSSTFYTIINLTAYKDYLISVSAVTSGGRGPYSASISVQTPESSPSSPPLLSLVSTTPTTITLSLKPPTDSDTINGVISYYLVTYTCVNVNTSTRSVRVMPPSADYMSAVTAILTALQEGVPCTISAAMHTSAGGGPDSDMISVTTEETAPTDTPQNIQFNSIQTSSFSLAWDSPPSLEQNGVIVGYRVAYRGVVIDTQWRNTTLTTNNISITNLNVGSEYVFYICASTSAGEGPCISLTRSTLELLPTGAPTMFKIENRASTYLSFSWSPPPILTHNGVLLGYTLEAVGQQYSIEVSRVNVSAITFFYQFTNLEEHYKYTVLIRAWNSIGYGPSAEQNVSTTESSPEGSPSNLTAIVTATSITFKWKPLPANQENGQLTYYEVSYFTQATFLQHTHVDTNVSATESQYTATGLEEYVVYIFRIRVYTAAGPGPYSTELSVRTDPALPSNSPTNPQLTVLSSTQIQVQWGSVSAVDQNGPIIGYAVSVSVSTSSQTTVYFTTLTIYTIGSLKPYTGYSIQIRANNSVGPGPYTSSLSVTTKQAPPSSAPAQLSLLFVTHNSVNLSWYPVSSSSLNGVFVSYSVQVTDIQAGTSFLHTSISSHTLISDLNPYTNYSLAVAAVNSQGAGPYSAALIFTTNQSPPKQGPDILAVIHISPSSVLLQWTHVPTHLQNGPIVSYTLTLATNSGTLLVTALNLSSLTNSTTLTALHAYTEYTVQLTASNIAGTSPHTSKGFITNEDKPTGPATSLTATPSSTSIILLWLPPQASEQNGVIILYSIRFGSDTYNTNATEYTFVGLEEVTEYQFSVAAWTSIGRGPFSAQFSAATLAAAPSAAPQNVTGRAESYQSILVKWYSVPAIHQNGDITNYIVYYQGQEHDTSERKLMISVTTTQTILTTLKPDEVYSIYIKAQNSEGTSPPSSPINIKTLEGLPTAAPTSIVLTPTSAFSFTVTWVDLEPQYHNGLLLHYVIIFQGSTFDTSQQRITVASGVTAAAVTNLHPANEYTVFLFASNLIGSGPNSYTVSILLPESVPSVAPTIENVTPGSTTILFVWGLIDEIDRNGEIIQYEIRYTVILINPTDSEQSYINVTAPGLSVTLSGLLIDTYYRIQIRAYTSAGPGRFSSEYLVSTAHHTCTVCVNGRCTLVNDENMCVCNPGYTGETCESKIDECADITCVHGSCKDGVNSYTCECDKGFKGQLCDLSVSTPTCAEETSLNFLWPDTAYGETAVLPCSESDPLLYGDASRACTSAGTWSALDVSECKKSVYVRLDPSNDVGIELTPITALDSLDYLQAIVCDDSNNPASGPTFFPSEILIVVSFMEDVLFMVEKQNASSRAELIPKLMPGIMCILSGILDSRNLEIFSLSNGSSNAIVINELLEEIAKLNAESFDTSNTDPILFSEENIHIYISPLTVAQPVTLPDYSLSVVVGSELYPESVVIPESEVSALLSKSSGGVPVIAVVFSRYLGQAIGTQSLSSDIDSSSTISTGVISIQNNLGETLTFSSPISLTFTRLTSTVSSFEFTCVYWDSVHGWTTTGLSLSEEGTSSVSCYSTHATSFTVLKTSMTVTNMQTTTYISAGAGIGLICLLAVVCCSLCVCLCLIHRRKKKNHIEILQGQYNDPFLQQDGSIVNPLYGSIPNSTLPAKDSSLRKGEYEPMQLKQENSYYFSSTNMEPEPLVDRSTPEETAWNNDSYSSIHYGCEVDNPYSEIKHNPSMNPFSEMVGQDHEDQPKAPSPTGLNPFINTRLESRVDSTNLAGELSLISNPTYQSIEPTYSTPFKHTILSQERDDDDA